MFFILKTKTPEFAINLEELIYVNYKYKYK